MKTINYNFDFTVKICDTINNKISTAKNMKKNIKVFAIITFLSLILLSTLSIIFVNKKVFATPSPTLSLISQTDTYYLNEDNGELDITIKLDTDSVTIDNVHLELIICDQYDNFKDQDGASGIQPFNIDNSSFTTINTNEIVISGMCKRIKFDATGSVNGSNITVAEITIESSQADNNIILAWDTGLTEVFQGGTSLPMTSPTDTVYEVIAEASLTIPATSYGYGFANDTSKNDFTVPLFIRTDYATIEDALAELSYDPTEVEIININNGDAFTSITSNDDGLGTTTIEATGESFNNDDASNVFATITYRPKTSNDININIETNSYLNQPDTYNTLNHTVTGTFNHKNTYISLLTDNDSYQTNTTFNTNLYVNTLNTDINYIKAVLEYDPFFLEYIDYIEGALGNITVDDSTPGTLIIEVDNGTHSSGTDLLFATITFNTKNNTTQGTTSTCQGFTGKTGLCLNTDLGNSEIRAAHLTNNILSAKTEKSLEITSLANMNLTSTPTDYKVGDEMTIAINIDSADTIISEATTSVKYDTNKFELVGNIDTSSGVMENYPTKITNPGLIVVTGKNTTTPEAENGILAEFILRALETTEGTASSIEIETDSETSQIIEESSGTNILNPSEVTNIDINTIAEARFELQASDLTIKPLQENLPVQLLLDTDQANTSTLKTYIQYNPKLFEYTNFTNELSSEWDLTTELIEGTTYNYISITGNSVNSSYSNSTPTIIGSLNFTTLSTTPTTYISIKETPDGEPSSYIKEIRTNYNINQTNYDTILETKYQYELIATPTMSITSTDGEIEKHLGTEFDINVNFNPDKATISEVQTIVQYDPDYVSYQGFNNSDIFESYTVSNDTATGTIILAGSSSNPVYLEDNTEILTTLSFTPISTTTSHSFSLIEPDTKIIESYTNTELSPDIPGTLDYSLISTPSFHINPDTAKYQKDVDFTVDINLLTDNSNINEATAIIDYDSTLLQFQSFTNGNISNMTYNTSSNDTTITITGTTDNNGFQGENLFGKIKFKTINNGTTSLTFNSSSEIIENISGSPNVISLEDCTNSNITITGGASISSSSNNTSYEINNTFQNNITLNTNGATAESLDMTLNYNSDILSIESYNISNDFSNCTITNNLSTFKLEDCTGSYNGSNISIATLTMKGTQVGTSGLRFDETTTILGEEGTGINILHTFNDNSYTIYDSNISVADLNSDGYVRQDDFTIWFNYYITEDIQGDLNDDGKVTQADFTVFYQEYLRLNS